MSFHDRYLDAHLHTKGPDDARPSAMKIVEDEDRLGKMGGKVAFITGGSQGIGVETVRAMHATGADVYFTVRNTEAGEKVVKDVRSTNSASGKLEFLIIYLDDLSSVKAATDEFLKREHKLNILINNAGIMATPESKSKDGYDIQFAVNYLSHFYLFQLLKKALLAGSAASPDFASRVVNVSSIGHREGQIRFHDFNFEEPGSYNPWVAYGQSKTALIWMTNYIDRVLGAQNPPIHSWSLHPGGIWSNLQQHVPKEMMDQWKSPENKAVEAMMKSPRQGASTTVLAAVGRELEGQGGKYLADCRVMEPYKGLSGLESPDCGHSAWAYSPEDEEKLWKATLKMLKLEED